MVGRIRGDPCTSSPVPVESDTTRSINWDINGTLTDHVFRLKTLYAPVCCMIMTIQVVASQEAGMYDRAEQSSRQFE